jgi:hypothetical protein
VVGTALEVVFGIIRLGGEQHVGAAVRVDVDRLQGGVVAEVGSDAPHGDGAGRRRAAVGAERPVEDLADRTRCVTRDRGEHIGPVVAVEVADRGGRGLGVRGSRRVGDGDRLGAQPIRAAAEEHHGSDVLVDVLVLRDPLFREHVGIAVDVQVSCVRVGETLLPFAVGARRDHPVGQ